MPIYYKKSEEFQTPLKIQQKKLHKLESLKHSTNLFQKLKYNLLHLYYEKQVAVAQAKVTFLDSGDVTNFRDAVNKLKPLKPSKNPINKILFENSTVKTQ